ncbi:MAG: GAF domain-containing protein [Caldilineaceae bacterium]|nr:GAF domain-containing protein [Caldilineaceae bacterium]
MKPLGNSLPLLDEQPGSDPTALDNYLRGDFQEADFSIEAIQTLLEVSTQILTTHDVEILLEQILKFLGRFVAYTSAAIHMVQDDFLETRAGVGHSARTVGQYNYHRETDFVWQYLEQEKAPYFCNDILEEEWTPISGFEYIRSFLAVPLKINGELIGLLTVDHNEPDQYQAKQVELVRLFGNYAAIAIHNAQLLADSRRYIKDLEILQTVGIVSVSNMDVKTIAEQTLLTIQAEFGYDLVSMYRIGLDALYLITQHNYPLATVQHRIPLGVGVMSRCIEQRKPVLIQDVSKTPEFIAAAPNIHSELCVPIFVDDKVYAVINIESRERDKLDERDLRLLMIVANRLGVAFQNLELYEEVRRRLATVSGLHASTLDIVSDMDERDLFDNFLERVLTLVDTAIAAIFLYDSESDLLVTRAIHPTNAALAQGQTQPKEIGLVGSAFSRGVAIYTEDYSNSPDRDPTWPYPLFPLGSTAALPLLNKGIPIGVMGLARHEVHPFNAEEKELLSLLANQIATAIENRRLFQTEQRRSHQLLLLSEITTATLQTVDYQETLDTLANRLGTLIRADSCFLLLWNETREQIVASATYRMHDQIDPALDSVESLLKTGLYKTGEILVVDNVERSPFFSESLVGQVSIRSLLCMPLQVDTETTGIALIGFQEEHLFSQEEINICKHAAAQISVAIAKARLIEMERRQRQAAEVQLAFSFQLMETSSPHQAIDALLATIVQLVDYDAGSVMLLAVDNPHVGYIAAVSGYTHPDEALHRTVNLQAFPHLNQIRNEGKEIYFPEIRGNERWQPGDQPDAQEVRSVLLVPLLYDQQSKMLGCLTLKSYRPNAFSAEERSNITLLCNQTASAIHNIRLMEESHRRLNEVSILTEMSEVLNRTLDLDKVLEIVMDRVMSILVQNTNAQNLQGAIILRQPLHDTLRLALGHNLGEGYQDFFNNRPFSIKDGSFKQSILKDEWVELSDPIQIQELVAEILPGLILDELLNIPLKVGAETIGVITANRIPPDLPTRRLLRAVAQLAGSAIHKTQLLAQARKRAVELMEAHDALNEMDRLRDEFIQNITHDLRAPLTFIRGYTDLMIEGAMGGINQEQYEALEIIQERTDAVSRLVNDILKSKQIESQPLREEPVEVVSIASTSVRSSLMTARLAEVEIFFESRAKEAIVYGDADRLGQVFDNLLSNAIKYNRQGGQVHVQIEQKWPKVVISIADTGIGIPEEEIDRVWNRYYRTQRALYQSGTGLGLANVRRIVEAHDGRIWVQSNNHGTIFTFELPLAQPGPVESSTE